MKTSVDRFTEALDREDLDEFPLEELFDLHIPQEGELVKGKIMSLVEWGAFVEIESGWSGLLHVSEITDGFVDNIEDYLHPGQEVECMVIKNREDRLDRLSLSMKRLNQPPNIQQALADGRMTPQDLATARPTPIGRRVDQSEELLRSMDIRLSAVEAVLSQLGYGEALREAQHEARDGTKRPSVPSMEAMLSSVPEERQPETTPLSTQNERAAIDMVLADLSSPAPPPAAGGGAAAGPPPGAGEGDRQSAAREVLDDVERREAETGRRRRAARRPARGPELLGEPTEEELLGAGFTGGL